MRLQRSKSAGEGGYVLLSIMLLMTLMLIALSIEAPRIAQQVKREKEDELMHRGNEYKNAVRKYFRKFGRYPVSIDQLESTNGMRFLRKRYKDPFTGKDDWRILHFGEVQVNMVNGTVTTSPQVGQSPGDNSQQGAAGTTGQAGISAPGQTGIMGQPAITGQAGTLGQSGLGQSGITGQPGMMSQPIGGGSFNQSSGLNLSNSNSAAGAQPGAGQIQGGPQGFSTSGMTPAGSLPGVSGSPVIGGGQIIGVESTSTLKAIKVINGKDHYNEWPFWYDPNREQLNGGAPVAGINPATGTNPTPGFGQPVPGQQPTPNNPPVTPGNVSQ